MVKYFKNVFKLELNSAVKFTLRFLILFRIYPAANVVRLLTPYSEL